MFVTHGSIAYGKNSGEHVAVGHVSSLGSNRPIMFTLTVEGGLHHVNLGIELDLLIHTLVKF